MGDIARRKCQAEEKTFVDIAGVVGYQDRNQRGGSAIELVRMVGQKKCRTVGGVGKFGHLSSVTTGDG